MARDIEEFLRRAAERRKQNQGQPAPPPVQKQRPPQQKPPAAPRGRLVDESRNSDEGDPYKDRPVSKKAGASEPQAAPPTSRSQQPRKQKRRQSVAEHVREAVDVSDVTENSRHLAEEVSLADEKLEARMEKFDHVLGGLEGKASIQQDRVETTDGQGSSEAALGLMELFKNPKTIRESILISEILKRPNFDDY